MTHFLKFSSEDEAKQVLAQYLTEDGQWITASHEHAIDVVGVITKGGSWDEDGNEITSPTIVDGFHVNFVGNLPQAIHPFELFPQNPVRVFA